VIFLSAEANPAAWKMGYLNALFANIPAVPGDSNGTHILQIMAGNNSNLRILYITAAYDAPIQIAGGKCYK
jgi:hypothetical protein